MRFRILVDEPAGAAHNMAVDEALYLSTLEGPGMVTLRLYRFQPSAVSFGYRQRFDEVVDPGACRSLGIDWVRRPTGGRALLHQHELTYCVTAPARGPLGGLSVRGVYQVVSDAIRRALEALGAPLDPPQGPSERAGIRTEAGGREPCLAVPGRHEITSRSRKLVASAQRRSPLAFLQHGAILQRVDGELWSRVAPKAVSSSLHAIGLDDLVPGLGDADLVAALRTSFEETLGTPSYPGELLPSETALIPPLTAKYRSSAWNSRCALTRLPAQPSAPSPPSPRGFPGLVDNSEAVW